MVRFSPARSPYTQVVFLHQFARHKIRSASFARVGLVMLRRVSPTDAAVCKYAVRKSSSAAES